MIRFHSWRIAMRCANRRAATTRYAQRVRWSPEHMLWEVSATRRPMSEAS